MSKGIRKISENVIADKRSLLLVVSSTDDVADTEAMPKGMLKVTLVKSPFGRLEKQTRTLKALGLNKTNSSNIVPDNAATRGMIFVVKHLVSVEIVK